MKFIKFIFSKFFWINVVLAVIALYVVFYLTMSNLDNYTNHGIKIEVPNLKGLQLDQVQDSLMSLDLNFEIRDSVFSDDFPIGMVIQQDPLPNTDEFPNFIKPSRTIYITIVKRQETFKVVPDFLTNVTSKNIGKSKLEMLGFNVDLEIKDHKDKDKILGLEFEDKALKAGQKLPKGSLIKIIFGSGDKGQPIELPDFKGMNVYLALNKANEIGLDLDIHYYDSIKDNRDSNLAVIYQQYPDPEINNKPLISIGSMVTIDANLSTPLDTIYTKDTVALNFKI